MFACFETGFTAFAVFFLGLWTFSALIEGTVAKYGQKHVFTGFQTGVTAFTVLIFVFLRYITSFGGTVAKIRP